MSICWTSLTYIKYYLYTLCFRQVAVHLDLWGTEISTAYRDRPRTLHELKTAISAFIRNISQADLQKLFANKIKRVHACIDAREHHFQQLLYKCTETFRTHYMLCICWSG
jgi:hypothetical protein